ncbi:type II toxin-antitoxin system CcdA family antitoxin [Pseudidiomarina mangrovi]|uniref:type II toxin-antitoxin system CcdA family antitoxin n=1 Tax=Pseudidiomarina mangrovi TaxID=2487133 RepID=UPI000FC9FEEA|nr:type II toxin-antitoxin system CcdA family antitoxin [Pseudidiomarina mangrovi]
MVTDNPTGTSTNGVMPQQASRELIDQKRRQQWLRDNQQALEDCNQLTEAHGLFADSHRVF